MHLTPKIQEILTNLNVNRKDNFVLFLNKDMITTQKDANGTNEHANNTLEHPDYTHENADTIQEYADNAHGHKKASRLHTRER